MKGRRVTIVWWILFLIYIVLDFFMLDFIGFRICEKSDYYYGAVLLFGPALCAGAYTAENFGDGEIISGIIIGFGCLVPMMFSCFLLCTAVYLFINFTGTAVLLSILAIGAILGGGYIIIVIIE